MEKRYQVFVSSTYQDLQEERQEVMQALLELECIPAGMELFPAANQDQWTLIKKVIDDCDYYILISAGRYGSIGPDGVGYTEMEYRYALEKGKPIMAFLHKNPEQISAKNSEANDEGKAKLAAFRQFVKAKMVRFWDSPADLGSQVSRSLVKLIKAEPAIGWVRADSLPSEEATRELLRLRKRIDELEADLQRAQLNAPSGAENLAQGDDVFCVDITLPYQSKDDKAIGDGQYLFEATWNAIFAAIAPSLMDEAPESAMRAALKTFIHSFGVFDLDEDDDILAYDHRVELWTVLDSSFQTIKIQLRALGLIEKSTKPRSVRDTRTMWTLTRLGDETMTRLRAVRKGEEADSGARPWSTERMGTPSLRLDLLCRPDPASPNSSCGDALVPARSGTGGCTAASDCRERCRAVLDDHHPWLCQQKAKEESHEISQRAIHQKDVSARGEVIAPLSRAHR